MSYAAATPRDRARAALLTAIAGVALGWGVLLGLSAPHFIRAGEESKLFAFVPNRPPSPPPPREPPPPHRASKALGAPAPPARRATATDIVAPPPVIPPPAPPPIATTELPDAGTAARPGASDLAGLGTGAGGAGNGRGGGGSGDRGDDTPPRRRSGRLKDSDYPQVAGQLGVGGTVSVRYAVETDGRVDDCVVTRSSGDATLDQNTCRLIEERFHYDPSRDPSGRPVRSFVTENHEWVVRQEPPER